MSAGWAERLDSVISSSGEVGQAWKELRPAIDSGKVASRGEACLCFSRLLKIANGLGSDEKVRSVWTEFLEQGELSVEGSDRQYSFKSLLGLFEEGKSAFDVKWTKMEPGQDSIDRTAAIINAIAVESIGDGPPVPFMQSILQAPFVVAMVARTGETPVAASYGTYVDALKLMHINFIGRRADYPGVRAIERLQGHVADVMKQFPELKAVTLCARKTNPYAQKIYESLGFEQIDYIEHGPGGQPVFFYGKKLHPDGQLPTSYADFKKAYDQTRKPYLPS